MWQPRGNEWHVCAAGKWAEARGLFLKQWAERDVRVHVGDELRRVNFFAFPSHGFVRMGQYGR